MDEPNLLKHAILETTPAIHVELDAVRKKMENIHRVAPGHADTDAFREALSKWLARFDARLTAQGAKIFAFRPNVILEHKRA